MALLISLYPLDLNSGALAEDVELSQADRDLLVGSLIALILLFYKPLVLEL